MRNHTTKLIYWFEPLGDLVSLLPRTWLLPRTVVLYVASAFLLLMVIPAFGITASGDSAPAAQAASTPAVLPGDATDAAAPPGYTAPYGTYANAYAFGNCTYYVASRRSIPNRWGNAINWYSAAQRAGFQVGINPAVGAIAWSAGGWAGHVAIVEELSGARVRVSEMNFYGYNRIDSRWVSASAFRYIY